MSSLSILGSCEVITFPCDEDNQGLMAVVGDCSRYYQCADRHLFECPCGDGTAFDIEKGTCIEMFFANCTCPNGVLPTTTTTTTPSTTTDMQTTTTPTEIGTTDVLTTTSPTASGAGTAYHGIITVI